MIHPGRFVFGQPLVFLIAGITRTVVFGYSQVQCVHVNNIVMFYLPFGYHHHDLVKSFIRLAETLSGPLQGFMEATCHNFTRSQPYIESFTNTERSSTRYAHFILKMNRHDSRWNMAHKSKEIR